MTANVSHLPPSVDLLLAEFCLPEHCRMRQGIPGASPLRNRLALALLIAGRKAESDLLRNEKQHVLITSSGVLRPAQMKVPDILGEVGRIRFDDGELWSDYSAEGDLEVLCPGEEGRFRAIDFLDFRGYSEPISAGMVRLAFLDQTGSEYHNFSDIQVCDLVETLANIVEEAHSDYLEFSTAQEVDPSSLDRKLAEFRKMCFEEEVPDSDSVHHVS